MRYINLTTKIKFPLLLQILAHHIYLGILVFQLKGDRIIWQYFAMVLFGFFTDLLVSLVIKRNWTLNWSTWIASSSTFLLLATQYVFYPYFVSIIIAIASKYLITSKEGHIFNPSNIGILAVLCLFPNVASLSPSQWLGELHLVFIFLAVGFTVSYFANRFVLAFSYIISFLALRTVLSMVTGLNFYYLIGPSVGIAGLIFTFHMITDPRTSPTAIKGQILFGFIVALLEFILRQNQIIFGNMLALAIACAARSACDYLPDQSPIRRIFTSNPIQART